MKKRKIVALVCVAAVLLLAVSAFGYVQSKLDKINKVPDTVDVIPPDQEDFETDASNEPKDIIELKPEEVDWSEIEPFLDDDLLNILLVGQDRREGEGRQRSDSMILCSINPDTKQISMISFLRDLYVQIPGGYSDNRLNAAYVFGGFPLLMDTLHTNFGVSIDGCFEVDFSGFQSVIDMYKGQLLPRCEHELWLMQLSMYYQSLYLQITKGYVRLKMECKDYILAQKTAIDALRFDPKDSELNMYAILAMGFQGNLSMAQTYYTAAKPYLALEHAEIIKKYLHIK